MTTSASQWDQFYGRSPLHNAPYHFNNMLDSPFTMQYLEKIVKHCGGQGSVCEVGVGTGHASIRLSHMGIIAEGIDYSPGVVERARQVNNMLGGSASFRVCDMFALYQEGAPRYSVIYHQGTAEHYTTPLIQAALSQQVALADRVVFSVPSVYYPFESEMGDERLMSVEDWAMVLAAFDIEELRYYGDPRHGEREHILCVLRGAKVTEALRARMTVAAEPYPRGISAIVHARNESKNIQACLETLTEWTDEIIVCDMDSQDDTAAIAERMGARVMHHILIPNFDRSRNVSAMYARFSKLFYLDSDERVSAKLGAAVRRMVDCGADDFEAMCFPFRHYFAGRWMRSQYPGYKAPSLYTNGRFVYNTRVHQGAQVLGRTKLFDAGDPEMAIEHFSHPTVSDHVAKLNSYSGTESVNMYRDGREFDWQQMGLEFVRDFRTHVDRAEGHVDDVHQFIYGMNSAIYRFEQWAKLYELRYRAGQLQPGERVTPPSVAEFLRFLLMVAEQQPTPQARPIRIASGQELQAAHSGRGINAVADVVWSGPLKDPSGYGEESRQFAFALRRAGITAAAQIIPWSTREVDLIEEERLRLREMEMRAVRPGFVHITQNFPPAFPHHPDAGLNIGRTMFETDRLPLDWVKHCNRMDYIWVPSEFNRGTFALAGVEREKLVVIPGCLDPTIYEHPAPTTALTERIRSGGGPVFLSVFDWTKHKGWDVLIRAWFEAFLGTDAVLVLKVWSTQGYTSAQIENQVAEFITRVLGLTESGVIGRQILFVHEKLTRAELLALYQAADAFVLPSRGEGWGRPYMEAMACGTPTLGTNWSGNTAFMTPETSYLFDLDVVDVPVIGWRELPTYKGHRWAEPKLESVINQMRRVVREPGEARAIGALAREEILARFSREVVGRQIAAEIARVQEERAPHLVLIAPEPRPLRLDTEPWPASPREPATEALKASPGAAEVAPVPVRLEGALFSWHSLGHVNREISLALADSGQVELSLVPNEPAMFSASDDPRFAKLEQRIFVPLSAPAAAHIRHHFPPRFQHPDEGRFILMQPWEYGFLPAEWAERILDEVDEVWCYTQYVYDLYVASGIPADKLHIIPLGVDVRVFNPSAPPYVFSDEPGAGRIGSKGAGGDRFMFLFVGGTLDRKGIDILLAAWQSGFSAMDNVCLVIKDTCVDTVYKGQNASESILWMVDDDTRAPVIYVDSDLTSCQMAGLYTAADCLVQPYRAEAFCLPALEAMACGVPAILPQGGPTDDFVDESVGWPIPAEKRPTGAMKVGPWECVGAPWMFEVSVDTLSRRMREVYGNRGEAKRRGDAAAERVRQGWTWAHTGEAIIKRLRANAELPPSRRARL